MNTVGKEGKLGEPIRCVVSVSMLTEGWDANTVTHILDRGRDEGLTSPLPPNRTGGFPASGFPVSGFSARCVPTVPRTRMSARLSVLSESIALGQAPATA